jgi:uncharacterized repeat protein (TIGR04076 family)
VSKEDVMAERDDSFELYDLRVEVVATERPMVCGHRAGDWFEVRGRGPVAALVRTRTALTALVDGSVASRHRHRLEDAIMAW